MKRILATAKFIDVAYDISKDFLVLTPNHAAAARLNVPHRSLRSVAERILNHENIGVATPLRALHVLKSVIGDLTPDHDVSAEAARVRKIFATVLRDGIDIAAMKKSGLPSAVRLAEIAEAYCEKLWANRLVDPESVLWKAGQFVREKRKILVYGYFRTREHDIHFIDKLADDGSVYVVPSGPESIFTSANRSIKWLLEKGWERKNNETNRQPNIAKAAAEFAFGKDEPRESNHDGIQAFAYPNVDAEVRATLAVAKRMIVEGTAADRIAIVCRKASDYERTIAAIAEEYGVPVCSQSKISLSETTLGSYISLILEAIETDFEFTVTARLLNHAYGPGLSEVEWASARRRRLCGIDGWHEAGVDLGGLKVGEGSSLTMWIDWLLRVVPFPLIRERAAENAAELVAYGRFCETLEEMKNLDGEQAIDFPTFSTIIVELLQTSDTRLDPRSGGIEFHQPNTVIGGEFDHIFVVGMAEGMLPATTNEDAVIDFYDQRRLEEKGVKLDSPVEFPRWEALSFYYVLLAARNGVTLGYPKTAGNEEKILSPYFERLSIKPVEARSEAVASPQEELKIFLRRDDAKIDDARLLAVRHRYKIERRRESSEPYDEYDGVTGIPVSPERRRWSVSQLTKIGQCPFKWFAEKILGLAPPEEADTDLRSDVMGKLYHKTLQIAVERAMNSEPFRDAVLAGLEAAFLEAEETEEIAVRELPNWEHRRSEHLEILRKAIESPEFIGEGSRVIATEKSYEANWGGFAMTGLIDRIDETPEGLAAIDYKLGSHIGKVKDETGELKTDLQLPIYSKVALASLFPGRKVANGHYYSIRQQKITPEKDTELDGFAHQVGRMLKAGHFAVEPDGKRESCKYCDFDAVCRRGQRLSRKPKWS